MSGAAAIQPGDALRYRLPSFQAKIARAEAVVAAMLQTCRQPYVAFSGGKDSLVVLDLARRLRPDVAVIWSDDELEYPEQEPYILELARAWNLNLTVTLGYARHGGWFWPWRDAPFWREPVPGAVAAGEPLETWTPRHFYDGCLLGLRRAEAVHRRIYLRARGALHETRGGWRCNPIAGWSDDEVWAYIAGRGLPYNPVYDRLAAAGVERARQRVGPLPLSPGWVLRAAYPQLWRALTARYGAQHWE